MANIVIVAHFLACSSYRPQRVRTPLVRAGHIWDPLSQKGLQSRWEDHEITGENIPMGHFINVFFFYLFVLWGVYSIIFLLLTAYSDLYMTLKHVSNCKNLLFKKKKVKAINVELLGDETEYGTESLPVHPLPLPNPPPPRLPHQHT